MTRADPGTEEPTQQGHLPTGAVTFLFTDIEGSTVLLERLRDAYALVLEQQRDLLRACFEEWHGFEVDTQGDSFFVAFPRPLDALRCTIDAQRRIAEHAWPEGVEVRVRMALHSGEALVATTGYVGIDVHRAARIGAAGHGGQVLVSDATRRLVAGELPADVELVDLGVHRLRDVRDPIQLYQLAASGLGTDFPGLRIGLAADEPPAPGEPPFKGLPSFEETDADIFFGRDELVQRLLQRLRSTRFLAVIGASGSGKSSILRAGVIPALARELAGGRDAVRLLVPGSHPIEALDAALAGAPEPDLVIAIDQFEEVFTLCRDEAERRAFIDRLIGGTQRDGGTQRVVIVLRADFYSHLAPYGELRAAVADGQEYIGPLDQAELRLAIEEPARRGGWSFVPGLVDLLLRDVGDEPGALPLLSHALLETWNHRRGTALTLKGYFESGGVQGAIARTAERVYGAELDADERQIARGIFLRLTELGEGTADTRRRVRLRELTGDGSAQRVHDVLRALADARLVTLGEDSAEVAHEALIREWPTLREWLSQDRDAIRLHRQITDAAQEWEVFDRDPGALLRGARLAQATEWVARDGSAPNELESEFVAESRNESLREQEERDAQRERELEAARTLAETERRRTEEATRSARRLRRRAVILAGALVIAAGLGVAAVVFGQQAAAEATRATVRELSNAAVLNLDVDAERSVLLALEAVGHGGGQDGRPLGEAEEALHRSVTRSTIESRFEIGEGQVVGAAFDPAGGRVAFVDSTGTAGVWDAATGSAVWTRSIGVPAQRDQKIGLGFSPDGSLLALPVGNNIELVDAATGLAGTVLSGHTEGVTSAAFSHDGRQLATSSLDDTARTWDLATGGELVLLAVQPSNPATYVNLVAFDPSGERLVTSTGSDTDVVPTATIWDASSGEELVEIVPGDWVAAAAFSPDGTVVATAGYDTLVKAWDAADGHLLWTGFGHTSLVHDIAFDPQGIRFSSSSADGTVRVWETATGRQLQVLPGHASAVFALQYSSDGGRLVTAGGDGTGRVWDTSAGSGREWFVFPAAERVWKGAYSPDGSMIAYAGVEMGNLVVRDALSGDQIAAWQPGGESVAVGNLSFSPDGTRLLTASNDGVARIWDPRTGGRLAELDNGRGIMTYAIWSPDGRLIAASHEDGALIWDVAGSSILHELGGHDGEVPGLAFSPDSARLVSTSSDRTARIWDVPSGNLLATLTGHNGTVQRAAYSPDGRLIATTSNDGTARIWDASTFQTVHTLTGHTSPIYGVAFSADGARLATAGIDSTIKIWDVRALDSTLPLTLRGHGAAVYDVDWSPDGKRLLSTSRDRTARVWALDPQQLAQIATDRLTRQLTDEECQQYLHVPACE
jgi:WD40 repeat protein/class 3 adenylate cyclase